MGGGCTPSTPFTERKSVKVLVKSPTVKHVQYLSLVATKTWSVKYGSSLTCCRNLLFVFLGDGSARNRWLQGQSLGKQPKGTAWRAVIYAPQPGAYGPHCVDVWKGTSRDILWLDGMWCPEKSGSFPAAFCWIQVTILRQRSLTDWPTTRLPFKLPALFRCPCPRCWRLPTWGSSCDSVPMCLSK